MFFVFLIELTLDSGFVAGTRARKGAVGPARGEGVVGRLGGRAGGARAS